MALRRDASSSGTPGTLSARSGSTSAPCRWTLARRCGSSRPRQTATCTCSPWPSAKAREAVHMRKVVGVRELRAARHRTSSASPSRRSSMTSLRVGAPHARGAPGAIGGLSRSARARRVPRLGHADARVRAAATLAVVDAEAAVEAVVAGAAGEHVVVASRRRSRRRPRRRRACRRPTPPLTRSRRRRRRARRRPRGRRSGRRRRGRRSRRRRRCRAAGRPAGAGDRAAARVGVELLDAHHGPHRRSVAGTTNASRSMSPPSALPIAAMTIPWSSDR